MQRSRTILRLFGLSAVILLVAVAGYQLLSGSTRIVVASGASMEPAIEAGDLIVVRNAANYDIGDIVAYTSPDLGTVLHRIVDRTETAGVERFILQGDANEFIDRDEPTVDGILGKATTIVPNGGPALAVLPVIVAAAFAAWWVFSKKDDNERVAATRSADVTPRELIGWTIAIAMGALTLYAVTQPTTATRQDVVTHEHSLGLDWSAPAGASIIYPTGEIDNADPLFLSEIDLVNLIATFTVDESIVEPEASLQLTAFVANDSGWNREVLLGLSPLDPASTGAPATDHVIVRTLDLSGLDQLLNRVADRTGFRAGVHDLTLRVDGTITGSLEGQPVDQDVALDVELELTEVALGPTRDTEWSTTAAGGVSIEETGESTVELLGFEIPISALRLAAPLLLALGLALALWPRRRTETQHSITEHFGDLVVDVRRETLPSGTSIIGVQTPADLLRLAELDRAPILHPDGEPHVWVTHAFGNWYGFVLPVEQTMPAAVETDTEEPGAEAEAVAADDLARRRTRTARRFRNRRRAQAEATADAAQGADAGATTEAESVTSG